MSRLSCSEMTTYHWSFDEDVAGCQTAGIAGIGVWRRKLGDFGEERGAEFMHECGLQASSLSCAGGFTGSDGQSFSEALDDALEALRLAADLRAGCLIVVTGARSGHTLNHARRLAVEALRILGDSGARLGVQIAVQPLHRQPERWSFLTSLDVALELCDRCRHPQVGMVFDVGDASNDPRLNQRIADVAPFVKLAALSDVRTADASGESLEALAPLAQGIRQLEAAGYCGWYDLQLLSEACWKTDYGRLLADCRSRLERVCPEVFGAAPVLAEQPVAAAPHAAPLA